MPGRVILTPKGPYDLRLSVRAAMRFSPDQPNAADECRAAVRFGARPALMEAHKRDGKPATLEVHFKPAFTEKRMRELAEWILHTDLDLRPFYRLARHHAALGPIILSLRGLVPMRTPSLFVMAVTAITEQQISLVAAYRIRERMIESYGEKVDGLWAFPTPEALAGLRIRALKNCGLSTRKAEYIIGLARRITNGHLDLEAIQSLSDADARDFCMEIRGIGPWAAEYMLIRGLGRPDVVPADDLGLQKLVGLYLGDGGRLTATQVREAMEPFAPFRGLAAFYMMVHYRLLKLPADRSGRNGKEKTRRQKP
jgi:DNA-3-methyladenine glycosylase II